MTNQFHFIVSYSNGRAHVPMNKKTSLFDIHRTIPRKDECQQLNIDELCSRLEVLRRQQSIQKQFVQQLNRTEPDGLSREPPIGTRNQNYSHQFRIPRTISPILSSDCNAIIIDFSITQLMSD